MWFLIEMTGDWVRKEEAVQAHRILVHGARAVSPSPRFCRWLSRQRLLVTNPAAGTYSVASVQFEELLLA